MTIAITFDPNDASDVEYVQALLGGEDATPAPAAKPAKKAPAKAAAKAAEPDEEPAADGVTLEQCVERAQELVAEGRSAEVKGALANFNVKRVSELEESQYEEFLAALNEESVV